MRLSEVGSDLHRFVASLEADPARQEEVEARLDLIAELRRRFAVQTLEELLERRDSAAADLDALDGGLDPLAAAAAELDRAEEEFDDVIAALARGRGLRRSSRSPWRLPRTSRASAWGRASSGSS